MEKEIKIGNKTYSRTDYIDFIAYSISLSTGGCHKIITVYISANYEAYGSEMIFYFPKRSTKSSSVDFDKKISHDEAVRYAMYIEKIVG